MTLLRSQKHINMENSNVDTNDIQNDIDVKPDFLSLQTYNKFSKCEIKQERTLVDIKNEVEDGNLENLSEDPLKVEIKTEENDFAQIENDNHLLNYNDHQQYFVQNEGVEDHQSLTYDKDFSKCNSLNAHIMSGYKTIKNGDCKDHKCNFCGRLFTEIGNLKKHVNAVHKEIKDHKCENCGKSFANSGHLKRHIKAVHEGIKDHKCGHCEKSFSRGDYLKEHIKAIHDGI